ncbi:hypothetical protein U1Q18_037881, partial [Sarracenia purpurea var. burkii]
MVEEGGTAEMYVYELPSVREDDEISRISPVRGKEVTVEVEAKTFSSGEVSKSNLEASGDKVSSEAENDCEDLKEPPVSAAMESQRVHREGGQNPAYQVFVEIPQSNYASPVSEGNETPVVDEDSQVVVASATNLGDFGEGRTEHVACERASDEGTCGGKFGIKDKPGPAVSDAHFSQFE